MLRWKKGKKRRENRRRRRRKVLWKPISLCPLPDLGPHIGSLTLSALAPISDVLRASVEGARKKMLLHCMVTKPWWGIKNSSPWVVFYCHLCGQTKCVSPRVVKALKQWKICFFSRGRGQRDAVPCSPRKQSHCPVQSGPWLCCAGSWESLGSSDLLCFCVFCEVCYWSCHGCMDTLFLSIHN